MKKPREKRTKEYVTVREMAETLGTSYSYARTNILPNVPHIKLGGIYLVREEAFRKYLKQKEG